MGKIGTYMFVTLGVRLEIGNLDQNVEDRISCGTSTPESILSSQESSGFDAGQEDQDKDGVPDINDKCRDVESLEINLDPSSPCFGCPLRDLNEITLCGGEFQIQDVDVGSRDRCFSRRL